ncbi:glycine zipper domain-containing protein [Caballeronia sp. LZ043]|uniref:DUF883 family protein n=1 Tax=Caballeronia sp. LZ043 TaxID=3038569 RepID=UPI002857522F|nr:hypothetical protein [Caballeronia sp. LZ043]MDR5822404.1 hypothetical protein [Caballeronia sp. LZ043]
MANTVHGSDPAYSFITERAETADEFPTSATHDSSRKSGESFASGGEGAFRAASQSWDSGDNASSSGSDMRSTVKDTLSNVRDGMAARYRAASETTDDFVHDNPWKAIALAAVAGLVVGMLASR